MEKIRITELDFEAIKTNLKDFLRNQSAFKDYDFEGSGLSVLIDLLAYNTHYGAYYSNMVANEMFLDTAIIRDSVLSHAKALNYVPVSRRAATANVSLLVTPPTGNTQSSLILDLYRQFESQSIDGTNYTFVNTEAYSVLKENGTFRFSNVELRQGLPQTYRYIYDDVTNPNREFSIPDDTVDTSTIRVLVQESTTNLATQTFISSTDITSTNGHDKVFFLGTGESNLYKLRFGDGAIGQSLSNGNIVIINYLTTDGPAANYANTFSTTPLGGSNWTTTVTSNGPAGGGSYAEDLSSIKYRAPIAYTTQNRMVTIRDYQSMILDRYPAIRSLSVWGGETHNPPVYGKVFLCYLLKDNMFINELEKQRIITEIILPHSVVTITPQFIDPDITYLLLRVEVNLDLTQTTQTSTQILDAARTAIRNYLDVELNKFDATFIPSRLQRTIDDVAPAIRGNDVVVRLEKRFVPIYNITKSYTIDFGCPLHRGSAKDIITTTGVYIRDTSNIERLVFFEETPLGFTGIDEILVTDPGFSYVETPTITITGDGVGAMAVALIINGQIKSIQLTNRGEGYTRATVAISGGGGAGAQATAIIQSRYGSLRSYYFNELSQRVILNANAGAVDYEQGLVTLNSFKPIRSELTNNELRISVKPESEILSASRNKIFRLDETETSALVIQATT